MSTEQQNIGTAPTTVANAVGCPRCHSEVSPGMQFCRSCGFRLFDGGPAPLNYAAQQNMTWTAQKRRSGPHWLIWVVVALIASSAIGGGLITRSVRSLKNVTITHPGPPRSYVGVDVDTVDGAAFVTDVKTPGGPADKAGLLGGDVLTLVDGMAVRSEDDVTTIMAKTPIGKTIDVAYLRDGVAKTTKLTTMSEEEIDRLDEAFDDQTHGFFGVETGDWKRVQVPGQTIYGVLLGTVKHNRPAYVSGLRDGDIVIEIDGIPIRTTGELNMRINRSKPDSVVKVVVMRGADRIEIPVTVGIDD
jgi:S1-C subfamily serine protease